MSDALTVTLRDGTALTVRPIRPADAAGLQDGFAAMSPESRYSRFLSGIREIDPQMLRYLTEVDHSNHEALVAFAGDGRGVAVGRYVRSPAEPDAAEVALTVIDEWQGRGLGGALLAMLASRARAQGVRRFTALMLASNHHMRHLLERLGRLRVLESLADTVRVEITFAADQEETS